MIKGLMLILSFLVPAQRSAQIYGVLTDSSGAVIPSAMVVLAGGGGNRSVRTAADGSYLFSGLSSGAYTLKVNFPGLEAFERRVSVEAGKPTAVAIQLRPEPLTQSVTVTDRETELSLDSQESVAAVVVKDADLQALPDNPDDLRDMLQALAGSMGGAFGGAQILVDGFSGGQLPPKSAIKEIKINPERFSADRDNWWSGIEIVTKPGASRFHGGVGWTDSEAAFNSRNPYATNKADYANRMFTANAGTFLGKRVSANANFYRSTIDNTALIDAVTLDSATLLETPVRSTVVVPRHDISGTGRLDYQISAAHALTGTYQYLDSHRNNNAVGRYSLESRGYASEHSMRQARLSETAVFSNTVVSDTRFAYTRYSNRQYGDTSTPSLIVLNAFLGGSAQTGQTANRNALMEVQSNTTIAHNLHTLRFGGRLRRSATTDFAPSNFGGTFSFFGVTNAPVLDTDGQPVGDETAQITSLEQYRRTLLFTRLGYPASRIRSLGGGASQFSIAAGNPLVKFSQTDLGVYLNDEWRARPNLTITFGFRYETQTNIRDRENFGPRLALAWSPGGKGGDSPKTVVRLGSGLFYYRVDAFLTQQALRFNGTTEQQYIVPYPDFYPNVPALESLGPRQLPTTYIKDADLRALPMLLSEVTVERQLPGKTSLSVTYVDQRTSHMPQTMNINAPLPGTYVAGEQLAIRPYGLGSGNIFRFESGGNQNVNWLEVRLNTRFSPKVSLNSQYQLVRARSNGGWDNATPADPYNFRADWSRSAWNGTHSLTLIGTVNAPWGIQFSPLLLAGSARPYDLTIGSDLNGDTITNDRPAFATDLSRPSVVVTKFGAFDTDPVPGQKIVPRNYLTGASMWNLNLRMSKTFALLRPQGASSAGSASSSESRYQLNFNVDVDNVFNHLNPGNFVGTLASPLFGQATGINLFRDTSNNRRIQLGAQLTF